MQDNKTLIYLMALEMGSKDINNFCLSHDKIKEHICDNRDFWLSKIEKERPGMLDVIKLRNYTPKKLEQFYASLEGNQYYYLKNGDNNSIVRGKPVVAGFFAKFDLILPIDPDFLKNFGSFIQNLSKKNKDIYLILLNITGAFRIYFGADNERENIKDLYNFLKVYRYSKINSLTVQDFKTLVEKGYTKIAVEGELMKEIEMYSVKVPKENIFI